MLSKKLEIENVVQNFTKNCAKDNNQYKLYVIEKINNGTQCAKNGKVSSHKEAKKRMAKWLLD